MKLHTDGLEAGVLDGSAKHVFTQGACVALAIALHDATGWPLVAITDHHNVFGGRMGSGSALHWTACRPDGKLVDIDGTHEPDALRTEYDAYADDGKAALGIASRDDAMEWYEAQGVPVSLKLAATFVAPLLESIGSSGDMRTATDDEQNKDDDTEG